jgi:hypothetical protein
MPDREGAIKTIAAESSNGRKREFESKLTEGRQRLLAHVIEHGLERGRRSPEDFIKHFPPSAIMMGLRDQPQLRANVLVIATGVRAKIALKKPAESCGNDLQIALDEGETDAETIVALLDPDDRVRYLEDRALWAYVTDGSFWNADREKDKTQHAIAAEHVAFIVERALKDRLLTHRDVVEGITITKLAELLPRGELEKVLTAALKQGAANKPYVETNLLAAIPMSLLVQHIPLPWIWDHVVVPKIADAHGFTSRHGGASATASAQPTPEGAPSRPHTPMPAGLAPAPELAVSAVLADASGDSSGDLDIDVADVLGSVERPQLRTVPRPRG